ncbi:MAG: methyltransferase domain-containing protein [Pseudomonadota bacterium]
MSGAPARSHRGLVSRVAGAGTAVARRAGSRWPHAPVPTATTRAGSPVRRLDPALEGLVDIVGIGECLPSRDASFNLVICTQGLSHVSAPPRVIGEIRRVLKPGAILYRTTPAIFPLMHDHRRSFARE